MQKPFPGFTAESFKFLGELAENNNKAWFDRNRARYEEHVVDVFRGLLSELEPFLLRLDPHFEVSGKTNRNFSRINRDIRFSKDKSPYKSNYYLYVFDRRRERAEAGRLYVGLSAECVTVGFSIYATWGRGPKGALETVFRERLLAHPSVFERVLQTTVRAKRYQSYWHRLEKGEWTQHPGLPRREEDWCTLHAWIVRKVFLPKARGLATPRFARQVEGIFQDLYPIYVFTSVASSKWRSELKRAA